MAELFCIPLLVTEQYILIFYLNGVSPLSPHLTFMFVLFLLPLLVLYDLMWTHSVCQGGSCIHHVVTHRTVMFTPNTDSILQLGPSDCPLKGTSDEDTQCAILSFWSLRNHWSWDCTISNSSCRLFPFVVNPDWDIWPCGIQGGHYDWVWIWGDIMQFEWCKSHWLASLLWHQVVMLQLFVDWYRE